MSTNSNITIHVVSNPMGIQVIHKLASLGCQVHGRNVDIADVKAELAALDIQMLMLLLEQTESIMQANNIQPLKSPGA